MAQVYIGIEIETICFIVVTLPQSSHTTFQLSLLNSHLFLKWVKKEKERKSL